VSLSTDVQISSSVRDKIFVYNVLSRSFKTSEQIIQNFRKPPLTFKHIQNFRADHSKLQKTAFNVQTHSTAPASSEIFQDSPVLPYSSVLEYQKYLVRVILELQDSSAREAL